MNKNYVEKLKKRTFYCHDDEMNYSGAEMLEWFITYEYPNIFDKTFSGSFSDEDIDALYVCIEYDALGKNGSLIEIASLEQIEQAYKESCEISVFVPRQLADLPEEFENVKFRFLSSVISDYSGDTLYCIAIDGKLIDYPYYMTSENIVYNIITDYADEFEFKGENNHTIDIMII